MVKLNLDIDDFLAHYWQKKPLLIRNGFKDFKSIISPEELAGLACEEDVFSRLVIEKEGAKPWQLVNGPFIEEDFLNLPETHYSLLVSECEKWIPELKPLLNEFSFIPQWRIDDLMISYAPEHGSVGPHLDQYDVFLIQAHGQRHWQIQFPEKLDTHLIKDIDLAILSNFEGEQDWILNPGDILYLPPGIAHHGVALNPCMTYSVGFRAPSSQEAIEALAKTLGDHNIITEAQRYSDPPLDTHRNPFEIQPNDIDQLKQLINQALQNADSAFPLIMGELMTKKLIDTDLLCNSDLEYSDADKVFKHPDALMAYHLDEQTQHIILFVNGESFIADQDQLKSIQFLCSESEFAIKNIPNNQQSSISTIINVLINKSILIIK